MKRFQLLVIVAAITAGAIWLGFYRSRHTSSAAVTALLPKDTLALVHLPAFNRSRAELHQTDLYQLWAEPAVQDFLQRPRSKIPAPGLGPTLQECESLDLKDAFVAVLTIEHSAWKIVGGFRFKGDPGNAEQIVTNWKAKLLGQAPDLSQETIDYQGHQIQAATSGIVRLSTVRDGQWFFFANDPEQLNRSWIASMAGLRTPLQCWRQMMCSRRQPSACLRPIQGWPLPASIDWSRN